MVDRIYWFNKRRKTKEKTIQIENANKATINLNTIAQINSNTNKMQNIRKRKKKQLKVQNSNLVQPLGPQKSQQKSAKRGTEIQNLAEL